MGAENVSTPVLDVDPNGDLWDEIRDGFQFPDLENSLVRKYEKWYAKKPNILRNLLERASLYMPYILEQTQQREMPTEIVLLPIIESAYNPLAYSDAGAVGTVAIYVAHR